MPTVYATQAPERFYLLPDNHSLPTGELYIRSLTGDELQVNAQAVQKYAIGEDEAKQHVRTQVAGVAKRTKAMMAGAGQVVRQLAEATRQASTPPPSRCRTSPSPKAQRGAWSTST